MDVQRTSQNLLYILYLSYGRHSGAKIHLTFTAKLTSPSAAIVVVVTTLVIITTVIPTVVAAATSTTQLNSFKKTSISWIHIWLEASIELSLAEVETEHRTTSLNGRCHHSRGTQHWRSAGQQCDGRWPWTSYWHCQCHASGGTGSSAWLYY